MLSPSASPTNGSAQFIANEDKDCSPEPAATAVAEEAGITVGLGVDEGEGGVGVTRGAIAVLWQPINTIANNKLRQILFFIWSYLFRLKTACAPSLPDASHPVFPAVDCRIIWMNGGCYGPHFISCANAVSITLGLPSR